MYNISGVCADINITALLYTSGDLSIESCPLFHMAVSHGMIELFLQDKPNIQEESPHSFDWALP
ncbi:hypothetical protein FEM48_Zijuj12G0065900 [Ziziphus jujuba var. spinosa]|uniref:Uncharacterized protein n=1 Tax=Ziziphus jujuba var. spinosa TaxID=714518 RepID=A0A978UBR2_ZIZJJ|nr:hypothetical protein FEM48_Zijuj12G0065900 [Ziziphus jujuba var. spinosa]